MSELLEPFLILKYLAAVLSLYVPGYAVLMCFDRNKTCVTERGLGATIAYSLLISCLLLTIVPLGLGMLKIHFLREFYFAYSIVSVLLVLYAIFKTVRHKFEPVKVIFRKWGNAAVSDKVFWILVVLLLLFLGVTCIGYPKMNWDGNNFYLRDAGVMLESNTVPYHYPVDIYPIKTSFAMNSLFGSTVYAYLLAVTGLSNSASSVYALVEGTNLYLGLICVLFLFGAALMAGLLARDIFRNRISVSAVVVLCLIMPFVVEYVALTSLAVDAFFCFFVIALTYSAVRVLKEHADIDWVMLAVALFLASVTKVIGIYICLMILGIGLLAMLNKRGRVAVVSLFCVASLALLCYRLTRDEWTSAGLSPVYSLLFILLCILVACVYMCFLRTPLGGKARLPGSRLVWAVLIFLLLALAAHFVRATGLTGSPFMYYQPLMLSEDARWGMAVVEEAELYRPWVGGFPGVPQLYPVSILVGYFVCVQLSLFLCLSIWKGLSNRDSVVGLVNLTLIGAILSWVLVFRMLEPRHIFWVTPFLAVSYVYGVQEFSSRLTKGNGGILPLLLAIALASTVPLMLVANLYVYGYDNGSLRAIPGSLKWLSSFDGWFAGWNILKACVYSVIVTSVMTVLAVRLGRSITDAKRLAVVVRWASLALVTVFLIFLCLPNAMAIGRCDSVQEREELYDGMDYGMTIVISELDRQDVSGGTMLCFWGWGVEYLTRFRFGYIQLGEPVRQLAGMREILQSRDPAEISKGLEKLGIRYALFPSQENDKRAFLQKLGEIASADLLVNVDKYFEPTEITSGPDGWIFYRRIGDRVNFPSSPGT